MSHHQLHLLPATLPAAALHLLLLLEARVQCPQLLSCRAPHLLQC
jgi:hypothetical protein